MLGKDVVPNYWAQRSTIVHLTKLNLLFKSSTFFTHLTYYDQGTLKVLTMMVTWSISPVVSPVFKYSQHTIITISFIYQVFNLYFDFVLISK